MKTSFMPFVYLLKFQRVVIFYFDSYAPKINTL